MSVFKLKIKKNAINAIGNTAKNFKILLKSPTGEINFSASPYVT